MGQSQKRKTALLVGATGLVGSELLEILLSSPEYDRVKVVSRSEPSRRGATLEWIEADFENLSSLADRIVADDVFSALGTTRKKAGSKAAFYRLDHFCNLEIARMACNSGARRYILVSAMGADSSSSVFYSRVKGELEEAVSGLGFPVVHLLRPSVLMGERKEERFAERLVGSVLKGMQPLLAGPLRKIRPIDGRAVASAMHFLAQESDVEGVHVHDSEQIQKIHDRLTLG